MKRPLGPWPITTPTPPMETENKGGPVNIWALSHVFRAILTKVINSLGTSSKRLHEHLTPHHNYSVLLPSTTHQRSWQANNWSCMISSSFPPLPCSSRSATGSAVSEPNMETSFLPRWCEETEARHNQPALSGKQSDRSSTTAKKKHQLQRHFKMCWVSSME